MRPVLLHNRIYRAFPELDSYTDDRCRKFIRAAQRGWLRRTVHIAIILIIAFTILIGGGFITAWAVNHWLKDSRSTALITPDMWLLLLFIIASPVAAYITRDFLLRRRVRWVLRTRGVCPACRYSLIGLPVSPDHTVTCPECAHQAEVDPSLGELVLDEAGLGRFRPSAAALPRPPRVFTPGRVRILKRVGIVLAILIGVGGPSLWGLYELWLRKQAATAQAERPGADGLVAFVESHQPADSVGAANAWDILQDVLTLKDQADQDDAAANPSPPGDRIWPDFSRIGEPARPNPDQTEEEAAYAVQSEALSRRLLEAYRPKGVYAALDRMALAPRAIRPAWMYQSGASLLEADLSDLGQMRGLARINSARMRLARERDDLAEYTSALEATLALSRIANHQPFLMDGLTGVALESMCYLRLHELLRSHPPPEWLDAIDAAIARQRVNLPPEFPWEGERLVSLDVIAWFFSDPDRVRRGRFSAQVQYFASSDPTRRLGTYAQNRDALDAWYRQAAKRAAMPRWQRPSASEEPEVETNLLLANMMMSARDHAQTSFDQIEMQRRAYPIAAALERYYASNGAYPDSLDSLVPSFLTELPVDPWTGGRWGYNRRPSDYVDEDPRGYLLYSFGVNAKDEGGRRNKDDNYRALNPVLGDGFDFIINDWRPLGN